MSSPRIVRDGRGEIPFITSRTTSADHRLLLQGLIEGFEPVLIDYLQIWNGESHREVIFDLIALHKPLAYERTSILLLSRRSLICLADFFGRVLEPLQRLSVSGGPEWIADMLSCLSNLVTAWALRPDLSGGASKKYVDFLSLESVLF